jgi:ComF family protein
MEFGTGMFIRKYFTNKVSKKRLDDMRLALAQQLNKAKLALTTCDLCGGPCQHYLLLCQHCFNDLPIFNMMVVNGDLLNWPAINRGLADCQFDHLISLAPHLWPFDHWLAQFKYHGRFELGNFFAHLLGDHWYKIMKSCQNEHSIDLPEAIMAVPIHITKWQKRGFNQAHLIAKPLSALINIPYLSAALLRVKASEQQVGKTGALRRKNLSNAFELAVTTKMLWQNDKIPEHVLLIDDVVTTGTTANEICQLLKQQGVKKVTLMTLSLSLPK